MSKVKMMDLTPTPRLLMVLEHVAMETWQCLAEIIDNSLDNFASKSIQNGQIDIEYSDGKLIFQDNGTGMTFSELENALRAGYSSKNRLDNLGLFGIGFNIAIANLGNFTTVYTKTKQDNEWLGITIDLPEMQKSGSFLREPFYDDKNRKFKYGTVIEIRLSNANRAQFERKSFIKKITEKLGETYSFLLRDKVPGLSGKSVGNKRNVNINICGEQVRPWLPCIWAENRTVKYRNETVSAVKYFENNLMPADLCQSCGNWQKLGSSLTCTVCNSDRLEETSRTVWGWIGVQRYLDGVNFGIDFLRNGRVIQKRDQSIFTFKDEISGSVLKDYPVEWPADRGRIVGEVHCDHVPVDFTKTSFQTEDALWRHTIETVRGSTSLQPKRATGENSSPLQEIFNAFRINEPGTRYLIPGNGTKAITEASKNWAEKFHQGDPDFWTDERWYKAAQDHDAGSGITRAEPDGTRRSPVSPTISPVPPSGHGTKETAQKPSEPSNAPPRAETESERMDRWKTAGHARMDLSQAITAKSLSRSYNLRVWETFETLEQQDRAELPVVAKPVGGRELHVFVHKKHKILERFGRNITDLALFETASILKTLDESKSSVSEIFMDLLENFPDEEKSEKATRSQINEFSERIRSKFSSLAAETPGDFWELLSDETREIAEQNAIASEKNVEWSNAIEVGQYAAFVPLSCFMEILRKQPALLMDGKLFKQHYATSHAEAARQRSVGYILRALNDLQDIKNVTTNLNQYEMNLTSNALKFLNESLA